jgi:hypothetical protein
MNLILLLLVAAILGIFAWMILHRATRRTRVEFCNVFGATHDGGRVSKLADAATSYRYLLYKMGTDADHVAICGAGETPLGPSDDQAEAGLPIAINVLGACKGTVRMVSDGTPTDGNYVKAAANGQCALASNGDVVIGRAIIPLNTDAATAGAVIEVTPIMPAKHPF